ncbi:MAG TPA: glycoside hydrolase family 88 protein [Bacillota bacterium]|nr:glycoside hydrolase family 88 protein [Bacillota bacterium]
MQSTIRSGATPWSIKMSDSVIRFYPELSKRWIYHDGVVLEGMEQVWRMTGEQKYFQFIKKYVDTYVDQTGNIAGYTNEEYNIDHINNGKLLFPLYQETGDERYKKAAFLLRNQLKTHPRTTEGGFWHKKIYTCQMWLDGLYMGDPFYAEFIKQYGEPTEFDDVAKQILLIEKHLKDPKTGLYYHGWDESKQQKWADPETGCSPNFWSRAIGWFMMAMVDVLDHLPSTHSQRNKIIEIFEALVIAISKVQDPATGLWYQVTDQLGREGNYLEASGSCMFIYAIAKAVRKGYIDQKYLEIANKGYQGVLEQLIEVEDNGFVKLKNNCEVAGLGTPPYSGAAFKFRDGSFEYYIGEPIVVNDFKGVGAFILASAELEMLNK